MLMKAIKYGMQTAMVAGVSEGLCATEICGFRHPLCDKWSKTTLSFKALSFLIENRDGLVIGEGGAP